MQFNFATMAEAVADAVGEQVALAHGERRITWTEFDDRSARLAQALTSLGVGNDSKVAFYLYNCPEYLEGALAAFKIGGVPVNVNYRYRVDELVYLLENADAEVLFFHSSLAEEVALIRGRLPQLRASIQVDDGGPLLDGALSYEALIAAHPPASRPATRADDLMLLYTGGTTGMPKGVMWRCCDLLAVAMRRAYEGLGIELPASAADVGAAARQIADTDRRTVLLPASPLMHGTGFGSSLAVLLLGGEVVTLVERKFDPHELWATVAGERVTQIVIVGDPFAKPMLQALEDAEAVGRPYDCSSLNLIASSGAMWSAPVKRALLARAPLTLQDALASSEAIAMGRAIATREGDLETAQFTVGDHAVVITDDELLAEPGSGEIGMLAVRFPIPLGYYKDPERTAQLIRTIDGVRYVIAGDFARVEADGVITLLGRGSVCINTGGEKVHPEEVEEVLKEHPTVVDAIAVGVPHDVWGEAVVAVVSLQVSGTAEEDELRAFVRSRLADYKCPKRIVFVDATPRGPNGKADYAEARALAVA